MTRRERALFDQTITPLEKKLLLTPPQMSPIEKKELMHWFENLLPEYMQEEFDYEYKCLFPEEYKKNREKIMEHELAGLDLNYPLPDWYAFLWLKHYTLHRGYTDVLTEARASRK